MKKCWCQQNIVKILLFFRYLKGKSSYNIFKILLYSTENAYFNLHQYSEHFYKASASAN